MKIIKLCCLCIFILGTQVALYGKIWRVNNQPGINADFNNLQAAHDAAAAGDTLYIEGSPTSYGNLNCTKKIFLFGPGYFLAENPNTLAITFDALVDNLTFSAGSDYSAVYGCRFNQLINVGSNTNNITVARNYINAGIYINAESNVYISQNYISYITVYAVTTGLIISNNIIFYSLNLEGARSVIVSHNVIRAYQGINATGSFFYNNILDLNGYSFSGHSNLFSNNITNVSTLFPADNGNQINVDLGTVFLVDPANPNRPPGISTDGRWQLKPDSPAKEAGFGSTSEKPVDCGAFGGTYPYVLSGLPPIPSIYEFIHQPVGSNADPLDVRVKVISRN